MYIVLVVRIFCIIYQVLPEIVTEDYINTSCVVILRGEGDELFRGLRVM
jgi:hypothetical protein